MSRDTPTLRQVQTDYDATTPDAHVIARQVVYQTKVKGKGKHRKTIREAHPKATDVAFSITSITVDQTTGGSGAPTVVVAMQDPAWRLLDSGFFDADDHGKLLDVDLNYPEDGRFWWRLHQISPQSDHTITLTFIPRIVAELMALKGPIKVNRAKRTRAEFLKMLCSKVRDDQGPAQFYSRELDIKQPIAENKPTPRSKRSHSNHGKGTIRSRAGAGGGGGSAGGLSVEAASVGSAVTAAARGTALAIQDRASSSRAPDGRAAKSVGIGANARGLTVKGAPMSESQRRAATLLLQVCDKHNAPHVACVAIIYAAIWESSLTLGDGANSLGYGGILASNQIPRGNSVEMARCFLQGGKGFQSGGAIHLANSGVNNPVEIAIRVEVPSIWPDNAYAAESGYPGDVTASNEAREIVNAGGGGGGGGVGGGGGSRTITIKQPYYFAVNAGEDYWTAMNRLAQEVAWELIVDGNRVYYDADTVLIRQKVAAVIGRDDDTTLTWSYDWENRHIATNAQVGIVSDLFEFCSGEVLQLRGFGAASSGSTAKPALPGRWLIQEASRSAGDLFTTFSLVQPAPPKPEPAPQTITKTIGGSGGFSIAGTTAGADGTANPFPKGFNTSRLDKGVDGTFRSVICSPIDGVIIMASSSFSNWGGWVQIKGPKIAGLNSTDWYFAEGLRPTVHAGQHVRAGQVIAVATPSRWNGIVGNIEFGMAASDHGGDVHPGNNAAAVVAFYNFCRRNFHIPPATSTGNAGAF